MIKPVISKSVEKRLKVMRKAAVGFPHAGNWGLHGTTTGTNVVYANAPSNSTSFSAASLMSNTAGSAR